MKLRNKKTGEIWDIGKILTNDYPSYDTLEQIYEEFEDYEEPKEHWCVTMYGRITRIKDDEEPIDDLIEIGNYFNSKEDAYDAWDKLKTWKRLKDAGFRFKGKKTDSTTYKHYIEFEVCSKDVILFNDDIEADLELLFGGEE